MDESDLSEYELLRLNNIRRNEAFLAALGLSEVKPPPKAPAVRVVALKKPKKKRDRAYFERAVPDANARRSRRLSGKVAETTGLDDDYEEEEEDDGEDKDEGGQEEEELLVRYDEWPTEPQHLDDEEFQVFCSLRAWRKAKCRELQTEPYKIFQNRTLAEAIRRKRNTETWGELCDSLLEQQKELLFCWGVGPKKVEKDGFAFELLQQLNAPENAALLAKSRLVSASATSPTQVEAGATESTATEEEEEEQAAL